MGHSKKQTSTGHVSNAGNLKKPVGVSSKRKPLSKVGLIVSYIFTFVCSVFLLWCVVSFVEVNLKNLSAPETISNWNFFVLLTKWAN